VRRIRVPLMCAVAIAAAVCRPPQSLAGESKTSPRSRGASAPESRGVGREHASEEAAADEAKGAASAPTGVLTLAAARVATLRANPRLTALAERANAERALEVQAGFLPNPELGVEVENVGGSGDREAFEETETTVWVSQLVPIGGKRSERIRVAALQSELAEWETETSRRDLLAAVTKAFFTTLAAQERVELSRELSRLAGESVAAVRQQIEAGGASAVEETRARLGATTAAMEGTSAERALVASRYALAAKWGSAVPEFRAVTGDLDDLTPPPPLAELRAALETTPQLARWESEIEQRRASIALERARRIPDPTVRLGARHFQDNDDNALVFEVSVPIPVFDRNQGNVLAAGHDLARTEAERDAAATDASAELAREHQELEGAYERALALRERALPEAHATFEGVRRGRASGVFRQLDVLEAQRTLFELRSQEIDALLAYQLARAEIEARTGRFGPAIEEVRP
jgi:outer membrane protein, heavy metal efflux system